mgnify:CR=1 FL=1
MPRAMLYIVQHPKTENIKQSQQLKKEAQFLIPIRSLLLRKPIINKVRAYRVVNGKKVYSGYSKVKGVKIK